MSKKNKKASEKTNIIKYLAVIIALILWVLYVYFFQWWNTNFYLVLAAIFAIYMLLNIWANDVANNMWPAVWAKALTIVWALIIAAIFEASWAIIAWGDVADTIKSWIIDKEMINWQKEFIVIMLATLLWSAIWINIATILRAPVSTTNSVVWALIWAWLACAGPSIVKWVKIWEIAWSWVISVFMWWIIAVGIYIAIRKTILKTEHKWISAKKWVPIYVWIIAWVFSIYILLKWLKPLIKSYDSIATIITPLNVAIVWIVLSIWSFLFLKYRFSKRKKSFFQNDKNFVNKLFNAPLVVAISILCFAHWSNDVANAIGPFSAIYETVNSTSFEISQNIGVPLWIMIMWGLWLSIWLITFWARLIKTVWNDITKIDQVRAFCIAMAAASTVLIASALWLPVSSTQITLWAIFGIWIFREYLNRKKWGEKSKINLWMMSSIILSWIVTLPLSWLLSAITYIVIMKI